MMVRQSASTTFKLVLAHLLVLVLVGSTYAGFHLTHLTEEQLLEKLNGPSLDHDDVFNLMDKTTGKKSVKIAGITLKELIELKKAYDPNICIGPASQLEARTKLCETVAQAGIANINGYCQFYLRKLATLCGESVGKMYADYLLSKNWKPLDYFRRMLRGHSEVSEKEFKSLIDAFAGKTTNKQDLSSKRIGLESEKFQTLNEKCRMLYFPLKEMLQIKQWVNEHNRDFRMHPDVQNWMNVYDLCGYFLKNYEEIKE